MESAFIPAADSLASAGSVTAPNGNVTALSGTPTPGRYRVVAVVVLTGTAETLLTNLRLRQNGAVVGLVPTVSGAGAVKVVFECVTLAGGTFDLNTAAAGNGWRDLHRLTRRHTSRVASQNGQATSPMKSSAYRMDSVPQSGHRGRSSEMGGRCSENSCSQSVQ
jgi:hypothetical protein